MSDILEVPLEDIYESEESMIMIFNDNSTGNGNIVTNNVSIVYTAGQNMSYKSFGI